MSAWVSLAASRPGQYDGIGDNAWHLARALGAYGESTLVVRPYGGVRHERGLTPGSTLLPSWGALEAGEWRARAGAIDGVVLHYYPAGFAKRDLPSLLRWIGRVRRRGAHVVLAIHEFWPPADGRLRRAALRALYRRVLRAFIGASSAVVVSHELAARELGAAGLVARARVRVIPIGSNIDRVEEAATPVPQSFVMFGQPAGMHRGALVAFGTWLSTKAVMARLHWIGRSPDELQRAWCGDYGLPSHRVTFDGGLPADQVSRILARASIGLAPYVDGASTRRSSLAALFAHGLPLVGLDGPCTDDTIRASGALRLSPLDDPAAFAANAAAVLADDEMRRRLSAASNRFFNATLAWPRIAAQYLDVLAPASPTASA